MTDEAFLLQTVMYRKQIWSRRYPFEHDAREFNFAYIGILRKMAVIRIIV